MSKRINPKNLNLDEDLLDDAHIQGSLNIEALVFRQIERTQQSAVQDETVFAANVRLLMNLLPSNKRDEIVERADEYTSTVERYQYKYWCGVPLGTPKEPISGSPALVTEETVDWYKMLEIILSAFEECGVTWKTESWTVETGKIKDDEPVLKVPKPLFKKDIIEEKPAMRIKHCSICGLRIEPGTGKNFHGKLVHKEKCLDACKANYLTEET